MCRNITTLRGLQPPATAEEVDAAALHYVRKVSGVRAPSAATQDAFDKAVREIAHATHHQLSGGVHLARCRIPGHLATR